MAQNITIAGASYTAVPAIDLPKTGGGKARFYDDSGTKNIVANGSVDVTGFGTAAVQVSAPAAAVKWYSTRTWEGSSLGNIRLTNENWTNALGVDISGIGIGDIVAIDVGGADGNYQLLVQVTSKNGNNLVGDGIAMIRAGTVLSQPQFYDGEVS